MDIKELKQNFLTAKTLDRRNTDSTWLDEDGVYQSNTQVVLDPDPVPLPIKPLGSLVEFEALLKAHQRTNYALAIITLGYLGSIVFSPDHYFIIHLCCRTASIAGVIYGSIVYSRAMNEKSFLLILLGSC